MAERRSNKERVLAKWPKAIAYIRHRGMLPRYNFWIVATGAEIRGAYTTVFLGVGFKRAEAWQDAARRLSTKGK